MPPMYGTLQYLQTTGNSRPFGVSLIISGIDKILGPQLYVLDPEGSVNAWNAVSIGQQSDKVMDSLSNIFTDISKDLSVAEVWPAFQKCLRKFFPSKSGASAAAIAERKLRDDINRSIALEGSDNDVSKHGFDADLPPTLISDSSEDGSAEEHWEFEVTSIMLNSEGEVCLLPMRSL